MPIKRNSALDLSLTSFGTGNARGRFREFAEAQGSCRAAFATTPFSTWHSAGSTRHLLAAAAINIMRACAPGGAQFFPRILHAVARARDLSAVQALTYASPTGAATILIRAEIDLEFLGEQHRQRGINTLPHFRAIDEDGDGIVRADLEPGVQLAVGYPAAACWRAARRSRGASGKGGQSQSEHQAAAHHRRASAKFAAIGICPIAARTNARS